MLPDTLQQRERDELVRRLYQLADMIRNPATSKADTAGAAEFIAHAIQYGWDWSRDVPINPDREAA